MERLHFSGIPRINPLFLTDSSKESESQVRPNIQRINSSFYAIVFLIYYYLVFFAIINHNAVLIIRESEGPPLTFLTPFLYASSVLQGYNNRQKVHLTIKLYS